MTGAPRHAATAHRPGRHNHKPRAGRRCPGLPGLSIKPLSARCHASSSADTGLGPAAGARLAAGSPTLPGGGWKPEICGGSPAGCGGRSPAAVVSRRRLPRYQGNEGRGFRARTRSQRRSAARAGHRNRQPSAARTAPRTARSSRWLTACPSSQIPLRLLDHLDKNLPAWGATYARMRDAVSPHAPDGHPVPEFLLHADGENARWKWHCALRPLRESPCPGNS
jgi:hypothetical protein